MHPIEENEVFRSDLPLSDEDRKNVDQMKEKIIEDKNKVKEEVVSETLDKHNKLIDKKLKD